MKKKLFAVVAVVLMLSLLPVPSVGFAAEREVGLAQKAGQAWVDNVAATNPELSQWQGASVVMPQPYNNLRGEVNAYMFSIISKSEVVGNILVGSSMYGYDMLEASEVSPPSIPTPDKVKSILKEDLGFEVDEGSIGRPIQLLYMGIDELYALYEIEAQKVAVNLVFERAILFSELKPTIPSPDEYEAAKKATRESKPVPLSSGHWWLLMYAWTGSGRTWCGPCSGVSIGAYYRDKHVPHYSALLSPNAAMYDYLYYSMRTYDFLGVTWPQYYGSGFVDMTKYCGYNNFRYVNDWNVTSGDYWTVVSDINSGWPLGLCIVSQLHWRAIKGYRYNSLHEIICTNSQTGNSMEYLNWDNLGYGNFTCCIKD